jgi:hypothetical protein
VHWSYATLKLKLRVTANEEKALVAYMKHDQPRPKPKPKRKDLRFPHVLRALAELHKRGRPRSVRNVQEVLRRYGITVSIRTVALDLAAIRKDL